MPQLGQGVNVGENLVPAMLSGRVAATLGGYWNYEAIQLRQAGKRPNVIPVDQAGVPTYDELVLVTTENDIANKNNELRRFVQALGRGYEAVRADPQAGVNALLAANPSLSPKLQQASVAATLPAFFPNDPKPQPPLGLAGHGRVDRLRQVDARQPPDHQPGLGARRRDQSAAGRTGAVKGRVRELGKTAASKGLGCRRRPAEPRAEGAVNVAKCRSEQ